VVPPEQRLISAQKVVRPAGNLPLLEHRNDVNAAATLKCAQPAGGELSGLRIYRRPLRNFEAIDSFRALPFARNETLGARELAVAAQSRMSPAVFAPRPA
jgi:hypothetical protein